MTQLRIDLGAWRSCDISWALVQLAMDAPRQVGTLGEVFVLGHL